ncbi:hypothetical protein B9T07_05405 [Limnospira fusiformis CCALA 023]|uniref:hypothetical protein n=1 Tax=Limnospira platensis TaxID=118562 RepID=UPI00396E8CF5
MANFRVLTKVGNFCEFQPKDYNDFGLNAAMAILTITLGYCQNCLWLLIPIDGSRCDQLCLSCLP